MIVEDNELNMKLFHDLLEAYGYRTIGTRNGFEVLDLARKRRPDLILTRAVHHILSIDADPPCRRA
jgi:two-component system cell cycle response regulator DivK